MSRSRRAAAAVAGAAAISSLLTACQKPTPQVTVLGGGKVVTISPSTYCFDSTHCRAGKLELPSFTLGPDDKVMIDVPSAVADRGWQVEALSLADINKVLGGSGPISGSHSFRVASNTGNGDPFLVRVDELHRGKPDGSAWSFVVTVSQTKT
ncbi:MAG: DUF2771 family protein [Jatrophihabitantaceae bacterium]